jgi:hypothetical protein
MNPDDAGEPVAFELQRLALPGVEEVSLLRGGRNRGAIPIRSA